MTTSMRQLRPCIAVLLSSFIATSAAAFDPAQGARVEDAPAALQEAPVGEGLPALAVHEGNAVDTAGSRVGRILDRLRRIPLRPVRIGDTPRKPDDPDPGAGVVLKIRF